MELLEVALRAFSDMCERGLRAVLTVPVTLQSLQGPRVGEIQRMVSALAQRDRLTHLRLELTHIPLRVGAESLVPVRELFRPYVRNVAFLLDPFQVSDQVFALDHVVLGADLNRDTRRADEEIFQALLAFRRRAGRRSTYALGLSSRLQVAHAITAGMAEISGSGVLGEIKKLPDQVAVIRRQDLALS